MKKTVFSVMLVAMVALCSLSAQAQLSKGEKQVNIGVGLIGFGLNAAVQYGVIDDLGVGLYVGFERNSYGLGLIGVNYSTNSILIGPAATYHFNRVLNLNADKFDLYVSGGILFRSISYSDDYASLFGRSTTGYDFLGRVGANYNLSEKMRLFGDFGSGGSLIQAGISFKF